MKISAQLFLCAEKESERAYRELFWQIKIPALPLCFCQVGADSVVQQDTGKSKKHKKQLTNISDHLSIP